MFSMRHHGAIVSPTLSAETRIRFDFPILNYLAVLIRREDVCDADMWPHDTRECSVLFVFVPIRSRDSFVLFSSAQHRPEGLMIRFTTGNTTYSIFPFLHYCLCLILFHVIYLAMTQPWM
ncbi:hypothetical protein BS47DRAFT_224257 [Hydnum rufescens UP504]|uniref:Neurotransmitter-gated ion-channel ligand-binding domain-containing protein n=1 Tax=Hydnum rufescens UP504 TaxID=1448309 RepID=A0A9P6E0X7_9AGAM|nr:hypothetical protein BS47DRAFT_224257 [Hydnum rufescens UP504]